jgi:hypothetical protein
MAWFNGRLGRLLLLIALGWPAAVPAQTVPHDPNLPTVKPGALRELSDNRIRQKIMAESQAPYAGRCVCPYQNKDSRGRSCKGRIEAIKTPPLPICKPGAVSDAMVKAWRKKHS